MPSLCQIALDIVKTVVKDKTNVYVVPEPRIGIVTK